MSEFVTTHLGVVYPWQLDAMGHLNVQFYVAKFDEGTWNMFFELGLTPEYFEGAGCAMGAVQQNITYRRELRAGELVEIETGVLEVESRKIRILHRMRRRSDGEVAAWCDLLGVHFERQSSKSRPFPEAITARASELIVADPRT